MDDEVRRQAQRVLELYEKAEALRCSPLNDVPVVKLMKARDEFQAAAIASARNLALAALAAPAPEADAAGEVERLRAERDKLKSAIERYIHATRRMVAPFAQDGPSGPRVQSCSDQHGAAYADLLTAAGIPPMRREDLK